MIGGSPIDVTWADFGPETLSLGAAKTSGCPFMSEAELGACTSRVPH
jgi:hypothetical protein